MWDFFASWTWWGIVAALFITQMMVSLATLGDVSGRWSLQTNGAVGNVVLLTLQALINGLVAAGTMFVAWFTIVGPVCDRLAYWFAVRGGVAHPDFDVAAEQGIQEGWRSLQDPPDAEGEPATTSASEPNPESEMDYRQRYGDAMVESETMRRIHAEASLPPRPRVPYAMSEEEIRHHEALREEALQKEQQRVDWEYEMEAAHTPAPERVLPSKIVVDFDYEGYRRHYGESRAAMELWSRMWKEIENRAAPHPAIQSRDFTDEEFDTLVSVVRVHGQYRFDPERLLGILTDREVLDAFDRYRAVKSGRDLARVEGRDDSRWSQLVERGMLDLQVLVTQK